MTPIKRDSLRCQQVYRNGIAGKRVHREHVEMFRFLGGQREASIARSNLDGRLRFTRITEDFCCDRFHLRVNFVEAKKDRKSTRLNSSHSQISYAVFCLKK